MSKSRRVELPTVVPQVVQDLLKSGFEPHEESGILSRDRDAFAVVCTDGTSKMFYDLPSAVAYRDEQAEKMQDTTDDAPPEG